MDISISLWRISAGFPSPADDWAERALDLNDLLVPHPTSTFFAQVEGDSMLGAGIHPGDILVVDKLLEAAHDHIIVAALHGKFTLKRLQKHGETLFLQAANPAYPPIEVAPGSNFQIWGVVTCVIHPLHDFLFAGYPKRKSV